MREIIAQVAVLVGMPLILFFVIATERKHRSESRGAIEKWCAERNLRVVSLRSMTLFEKIGVGGSNMQSAYRAVLEDSHGFSDEFWFLYGS